MTLGASLDVGACLWSFRRVAAVSAAGTSSDGWPVSRLEGQPPRPANTARNTTCFNDDCSSRHLSREHEHKYHPSIYMFGYSPKTAAPAPAPVANGTHE